MNGDGKTKLKVQPVCKALGYSRQAYYQERTERRRKAVNEQFIIDAVIQARLIHPRCGTRKLLKYTRETLLRAGLSVGRDRFFEILRTHDMLVKRRKAFEPKTTQFNSSLPLSPNLVTGRVFDGPNQVFVADITYIRCADRFLYLTLITDLFSKDIVGWYRAGAFEMKPFPRRRKSGPAQITSSLSVQVCKRASGQSPVLSANTSVVGWGSAAERQCGRMCVAIAAHRK